MVMFRGFVIALVAFVVAATPLDDYVNTPDSHYGWVDTGYRLNGTSPDGTKSWTGYVLNMTSQQWLTEVESSRSIWWHIQVMIVPSNLNESSTWGQMYITGSNNEGNVIPSASSEDILVAASIAMSSGVVTATLFQVPNEHILFPGDPLQKSRTEDAIIAYTWAQFIKDTSKPEWVLQLPMVKSCVRGLDTIVDWTTRELGLGITQFGVAGASKRGWATWLTGAVDLRVAAIAPIVFDELNFVTNIHHHWRSLGGWSFAFEDYWEQNITLELDTDEVAQLFAFIDPLNYKDRLTMPKMVCDSTGDEFFLLDDQMYWKDMLDGPLNHIIIPNAEHSMATGVLELVPAIGSFLHAIQHEAPVPEVDWTIDATTGDINVTTNVTPKKVQVWHAHTCNDARRDFRLANGDDAATCLKSGCGIPVDGMCINLKVLWEPEELEITSDNTWSVHMDPPEDGRWKAFLVDFIFENQQEHTFSWPIDRPGDMEFTTGVSIVPNTFPFEDCHDEGCYGTLV